MNDWLDAEHHAERAQRLAQAGQWDRALEEFTRALRVIPNHDEWLLHMAVALDALQRYDEAVEIYERVLKLRGDNVETLLRLGTDLVRSEQPDRAIEAFERAAEIDRDCEPAFCHRIAAYAQLGDFENAELMFYMARQLVEECPVCYDYLAQSLMLRDDLAKAAWAWRQTLRLEPHYPGVPASLARVYWQLGQRDQALEHFERQLREEPRDLESLMALGVLHIEMGNLAEAGEKLRRVVELDPTLCDAHVYLGELALLSGHLDGAEARFQRVRQLDPEHPGAAAGLAQVALLRDDRDAARRYLSEELQCFDHTPRQIIEVSRLLIELEMAEEAVQLLAPVVEDALTEADVDPPLLSDALLCRGAALMMLGEFEDGIADTTHSVRLAPDNAVGMHNLALGYLAIGQPGRAAVWARRAIKITPDDTHLRRTYLRVLRRLILDRGRRLLARLSPFSPRPGR